MPGKVNVRGPRALVTALCLALLSCGGDEEAGSPTMMSDAGNVLMAMPEAAVPAPVGAKFSEIYPLIFPNPTNPRCDNCHSMPPSDISNGKLYTGMDQATAHAALVGKASTSRKCMGRMIVAPGQPEMSLLWQKLGPNPPCGSRMPLGGAPLSDENMEKVRSWIAAGAQNN